MVRICSVPLCDEEKEMEIRHFCQNSRECQKSSLFFAFKGKQVDGHHFLYEVAERGASAAVVNENYEGNDFGLFLFHSSNVLRSLHLMAKESLINNPVDILGITGSVGKTTTKEFVSTLLLEKYRVTKSPGSWNSQITFPLNILNRKGDEEILILEMGLSQKGELGNLIDMAPPKWAMITKVGLAHSEGFPDGITGIISEKGKILSHQKIEKAVISFDLLEYLEPRFNYVTFSLTNPSADFFLWGETNRISIWEKGMRMAEMILPFSESHLKENFLAACAMARVLGLTYEEIQSRIPFLSLPKMRFEKIEQNGILWINDAYNSNPSSLRAALENFPNPRERGRKIAILGGMRGLGIFSEKCHREMAEYALKVVDLLFCLGKEWMAAVEIFEKNNKTIEIFEDKEVLAKRVKESVKENDVVLLKGSRVYKMEEILEIILSVSLSH